jgi:hypothetical protein
MKLRATYVVPRTPRPEARDEGSAFEGDPAFPDSRPAEQTDKVVLSSRQIAWQVLVTLTEAVTAAPRASFV